MNKHCLTLLLLVGSLGLSQAQLVNDGGTITVQSGAMIYVEGDVQNQNSATFSNSGTIEVTEDFTNSATFTSAADSKVIFSGANPSNVDAGGATFAEVEINKDAGIDVNLVSDMIVDEDLNFVGDDNKINLATSDLVLNTNATATSYDDNEYINTDGSGQVVKNSLSSFEYPVGNGHYTPVTIAEAGTTDNLGVRVLTNPLEDGTSGTAITMDAVDAAWVVTEGTAGGSDLTVTPQWYSGDELTGLDNSNLGVARYDGSAYEISSGDLGARSGADPYTTSRSGFSEVGTFIVGDDAFLRGLLLAAKAFLSGPYNGTDMNDDLRAADLIPTTEPYTAMSQFTHVGPGGGESVASTGDFDQTGTDDDVVDWMFIELRDKNDDTNVLATRAALIQRDGDIVDTDGGPVRFDGVDADDYFVAIRHRNHLGVMGANLVSLSGSSTTLDFTDGSVSTFGTNAQNSIGGTGAMWSGNANSNGEVRYNGTANDVDNIRDLVLGEPNNFLNILSFPINGYNTQDVNMNGVVRYNGTANDIDHIRDIILGLSNNFLNILSFPLIEQLP